jgi:hypothetical protein
MCYVNHRVAREKEIFCFKFVHTEQQTYCRTNKLMEFKCEIVFFLFFVNT